MTRDVLDRVALAIQDESMTRLQAIRYARAALRALALGDRFDGMVVCADEKALNGLASHASGAALDQGADL